MTTHDSSCHIILSWTKVIPHHKNKAFRFKSENCSQLINQDIVLMIFLVFWNYRFFKRQIQKLENSWNMKLPLVVRLFDSISTGICRILRYMSEKIMILYANIFLLLNKIFNKIFYALYVKRNTSNMFHAKNCNI